MLTSPVNISEGRDAALVGRIAAAAGDSLLDVHTDASHNRSVLTLGGTAVEDAAREVARLGVESIDVHLHTGVHPRVGAVDVVPFVPRPESSMEVAIAARDAFAEWIARELSVPAFKYGPERSLPEIRRGAFGTLRPDAGPQEPHPSAGACCVGARPPLVAWNVLLAEGENFAVARRIARELRRDLAGVRALAFDIAGSAQVSCNLIDPALTGPDRVYDFIASRALVERCELVGLIPDDVLRAVARDRWALLDLSEDRTLEARLGG